MPEETKKEVPVSAPAPDTRLDDANKVIATLTTANGVQRTKIEALENALDALEKKLKSTPTGNVVLLDGKTWEIRRTVKAKFALEEVKRGNIQEDASLIVTDRTE